MEVLPVRQLGMYGALTLTWVISRWPMYQDVRGLRRYPYLYSDTFDILDYERWSQPLHHGVFPAYDSSWQYPPGSAAVFLLPRLFGRQNHVAAFEFMAIAADLGMLILLAWMSTRHASWAGCWYWVIGIPLIGPLVYGRFDIFPTLIAILAVACAGRWWVLGGSPASQPPSRSGQ